MNKQKTAKIIVVLTAIMVFICIIFATCYNRGCKAITRYEWIELLCKRENIEGYNNPSFYSDVNETNEYYEFVQAAVERNIIPSEGRFKGDKAAKGKFVALTAMRSVGEGRLKLALEIEEDIEDEDYIDIAVEHGLISKRKLNSLMNEEDCEELLNKLDELYYTDFLRNDYEYLEYADGVIEIRDDDIMDYSPDYTLLELGSGYDNLSDGDVIVFTDKRTNTKVARKIIGKDESGIYQLDIPSIEEVIGELKVSDVFEISADDIIDYYECEETIGAVNSAFFNTPHSYESKGFKVKVETDDSTGVNKLVVSIIKNEHGEKYEIPSNIVLDDDEDYSGELNLERLAIAAMVSLDGKKIEYADIGMDMDMHVSAGFESEVKKRIPLFEVPLPLGETGVVRVIVRLNLFIDAKGNISLAADIPITYDVGYDSKTKGFNKQNNISIENGEFLINCSGELSAEIEGILQLAYTQNIVDAEIALGATAEASEIERQNGMTCFDIDAKVPIVRFAMCDDDEADSLLGKVYDADRLKTILDSKAKRKHYHYEIYPDGEKAFVDECTYKETESKNARERIMGKHSNGEINEDAEEMFSSDASVTYRTKYGTINAVTCPTFEFDYPDNWMIKEEYFDPVNGIIEQVVLVNDNGAQINYMHYLELNAGGFFTSSGQIQKVADSKFIPSYPAGTDTDMSSLGNFVVARLHSDGSDDSEPDYDFYGVIPENRLGTYEDVMGTNGLFKLLSFEYPKSYYCIIANPPIGGWSEQERREMIYILSSFRVAE